MSALLRSLIYELLFLAATVLCVLVGLVASLVGREPTLAVVLRWVDINHWLVTRVLGIRIRVEGMIPDEPRLIAVKHESMLETLEMVRITSLPVIVIKRELAAIPLFGFMTRRYGVIEVERSAGAKALRALVSQGRAAVEAGRSIVIYPEGTRVPVGEAPPLKSGFAALYRAIGLPVVPVGVDSGRLWGRGLVHQSGTMTIRVGEEIPAGLKREEIETRVHAAINALNPPRNGKVAAPQELTEGVPSTTTRSSAGGPPPRSGED